jgi:large subunit ribosomal protein L2
MALKKYHPTSAGTRHKSTVKRVLSRVKPEKALLKSKSKITGRNNRGVITIRHRGGGEKRRLRIIDFKRAEKAGVMGKVDSIQYDPNRSANLALIIYTDGDKRYILAPKGLIAGDSVMVGETAEIKPGNALPLRNIPLAPLFIISRFVPVKAGKWFVVPVLPHPFKAKRVILPLSFCPVKKCACFRLTRMLPLAKLEMMNMGQFPLAKLVASAI